MVKNRQRSRVDRIDAWLVRHKWKDAALSMGQYGSYLAVIVCLLCTVVGLLMHVRAIVLHSEDIDDNAAAVVAISLFAAFGIVVYRVRVNSYNRMMRFVTISFAGWYGLTAFAAWISMRPLDSGRDREALGFVVVYCLVQGFFAIWMFMKLWRAKDNDDIKQYTKKWKFYQYLMLFFGIVAFLTDKLLCVSLPKALSGPFVALMCFTQAKDLYSMDTIPRGIDDTCDESVPTDDTSRSTKREMR